MTKTRRIVILTFLTGILSCQSIDQGCKQIQGDTTQPYQETGCNCATADNLCTQQCKIDYPAPEGKVTFGVAGETMKGAINCKCYQKRIR